MLSSLRTPIKGSICGRTKHRIQATDDSPIGETRWWSKHDALKKVFCHSGKPQNGLFTDAVLEGLKSIGRDFKSVKAAADTFVQWTTLNIERRDEETDVEVESALP